MNARDVQLECNDCIHTWRRVSIALPQHFGEETTARNARRISFDIGSRRVELPNIGNAGCE